MASAAQLGLPDSQVSAALGIEGGERRRRARFPLALLVCEERLQYSTGIRFRK